MKNNQQPFLTGGLIAVIVVVVIVLFATQSDDNSSDDAEVDEVISEALDGDTVEDIVDNSVHYESQGQRHLGSGEVASEPYNSNPPTSGPHAPRWSDTGVFLGVLPDIQLIHNLEHGHIWFTYRDEDDQEAIDLLSDLQSQFPQWVVVSHRPENDSRIAAAAWTYLLTLEELDETQLLAFIANHRDNAPESIPG